MKQTWQPLEQVWQEQGPMGRKRLAKAANCSHRLAQEFLRWKDGKREPPPETRQAQPPQPPPDANENVSVEYSSDKASITTTSFKITNLAEALAAAKVDTDKWEVSRHVINWWDVTFKTDSGPITRTNFQIKVYLQPRVKLAAHEAMEKLTDSLVGKGPSTYHPPVKTADPHMLEISLMDHHFGKLAWKPETGSDYDLKIAAELYRNAVHSLVDKAKGFSIEKILFPIGQDFFNIDNNASMTTGGTPQECDGRLAKIYEVGCQSVLSAIDHCAKFADVKVIWVPGNHDRQTSYYLCKYVEAWYRNCGNVTVDAAPTTRKYETYGVNLIGFTHQGKMEGLSLLMMSENRDSLAGIKHMEVHAAHYHKRKEMQFVAGDSFGPITVRLLPSLTGTDNWHYEHGFVGGQRAAEAYLWSRKHGYTGHFSANVV